MTDMELFKPGEKLVFSPSVEPTEPRFRTLCLEFPGRIHITPIDCNRFDFGKPGGGGVGFAVSLDNTLRVELSNEDTIEADSLHEPLIRHYRTLIKLLFNYSGGLSIRLRLADVMRQHSGLGSSAAIATACTQGINMLFGSPLRQEDVRKLVSENFVEVCGDALTRGLETGVAPFVVLNGGLAVMGDEVVAVYSTPALNDMPVVLVSPHAPRPESDRPESLDMLRRSLVLDASYRYTRAYGVLMDFVPAIARGDLRAAGDVVWDFQFGGTHLSMVQARYDGGLELIRVMTLLRQSGGIIVGMSSVGPTLYAVSEDPSNVIDAVSDAGLSYLLTQVSSKGIEYTSRE